MNTISIIIPAMIIAVTPLAFYIDAVRRNRDGKGRFIARKQIVEVKSRLIPIYQFGRIIGHITL